MNESLWATSAKIIVPVDALIGIALNVLLIVALWRTDIGKSARVYRITIMITAVLGVYFAFLLLIIQDVFILVDGNVANVLYGPVLDYLPERMIDIVFIAFLTQAHTLWQLLPGQSIVQWMHLAKPDTSAKRRLLIAYTVPMICNANTLYFMSFNIPDQALKVEMIRSISALHGSDPRTYHIYGVRIIANQGIDLLAMISFDVLPSYIICYGIFTICAIQIRIRLQSYGTTASKKTSQIQKRFFRSQIIQVFMPLVLSAVPISIALIAVLGGLNLANASFILIYSLWLMPSATASIFLIFIAKSSSTRTVSTPNVSTSKMEPTKPEEAQQIAARFRKITFYRTDRVVEIEPHRI